MSEQTKQFDKELSSISRWLGRSNEAYDDWEWDGQRLIITNSDGNVLEVYSRDDLIAAEVI